MTQYVFGLFRRVANRPDLPEEESNRIQEAHMANLRQLTERGELLTAGPCLEDSDLRGLMILSTGSVERARELTRDDPAILAGRIFLEFYTWYAPAGLQVVPPSPNVAKTSG